MRRSAVALKISDLSHSLVINSLNPLERLSRTSRISFLRVALFYAVMRKLQENILTRQDFPVLLAPEVNHESSEV